jgi:arylsulfatase
MIGKGAFDKDRWQLFHTDEDRSELNDLSEQRPEKVKELVDLWYEEAKANNVLPLSDLGIAGKDLEVRLGLEYHVAVPPSGQYVYYPGTSSIPEHSAANTHAVSYKILADVSFTPDTEGVVLAQGSRFGGHALFVKDGSLHYVYNFIGIPPEQRISAPAPNSGRHIVGVEFTKERQGERRESHGPLKLHIDDEVVAEEEIRTMTGYYALCGEGLCIGYDSGDSVSSLYRPKFEFGGGEIHKVVFDVADDAYVDVERQLAAAMARD